MDVSEEIDKLREARILKQQAQTKVVSEKYKKRNEYRELYHKLFNAPQFYDEMLMELGRDKSMVATILKLFYSQVLNFYSRNPTDNEEGTKYAAVFRILVCQKELEINQQQFNCILDYLSFFENYRGVFDLYEESLLHFFIAGIFYKKYFVDMNISFEDLCSLVINFCRRLFLEIKYRYKFILNTYSTPDALSNSIVNNIESLVVHFAPKKENNFLNLFNINFKKLF
jgi:hypothetical protein